MEACLSTLPTKLVLPGIRQNVVIFVPTFTVLDFFSAVHKRGLQCFDTVGWAAGRASSL